MSGIYALTRTNVSFIDEKPCFVAILHLKEGQYARCNSQAGCGKLAPIERVPLSCFEEDCRADVKKDAHNQRLHPSWENGGKLRGKRVKDALKSQHAEQG